LNSASETIEHIFPEFDPNNNWTGLMGKEKNAIENNVNRIGNLAVLTPQINSRCGTKSFSNKKLAYKDALLHVINDVVYINYIDDGDKRERANWNKDSIELRENLLIDVALVIWG
jgi:hypothetical protein